MWTVIKFNKNNINLIHNEINKKLGSDVEIYVPKFLVQKFKKTKLINIELNLLGDYLFCFHNNFVKEETLHQLKFTKGLKYFLTGFNHSQKEIKNLINQCKKAENKNGYLNQNFIKLLENTKYRFSSGPFSEKIFKIINLQKNKIDILLGNIKTTIKRKDYFFTPL